MAKEIKKEDKKETVKCIYTAVTPCHFTHDGNDYSLYHNETYDLPVIPFTESLIGQGRLVKK